MGGVMALSTGLGATAIGYAIQGWFKFGGVELLKIKAAQALGDKKAYENKTAIYLGAAAGADFFLCPLEAARIRSVSDPAYGSNLASVAARLVKEEGVLRGFYSGFGPILFKQIPYTMAKFAVQGMVADGWYESMNCKPDKCSTGFNTVISLGSGTVAGVVAAVISHPADTLLSKMNKKG